MHDDNDAWVAGVGPSEARFGNWPVDCFPQLINWTDHTTAEDNEVGMKRWSMILRYYNGGSGNDLLRKGREIYGVEKPGLPEWIIWHIVVGVSKALAYLQLGYQEGQQLPATGTWDPIMQRDLAPRNVFFHWNDDSNDPYPQVILGDFGLGARLSDTNPQSGLSERMAWSREQTDISVHAPFEDIQAFGYMLASLMGMYDSPEDWADEVACQVEMWKYSDDLAQLANVLHLNWAAPPGPNYPDAQYLLDTVVPMAERNLARLRQRQPPSNGVGPAQSAVERDPWTRLRKVTNRSLYWVERPLDLWGDPEKAAKNIRTYLPNPWQIWKAEVDVIDLAEPNWATRFVQKKRHITPWAPDPDDGPEENLSEAVDGDPVRVVDSKTFNGGWVRYLTQVQGEAESQWLTHFDFPGEKRKLVHAFHKFHPNATRGRQECIDYLR